MTVTAGPEEYTLSVSPLDDGWSWSKDPVVLPPAPAPANAASESTLGESKRIGPTASGREFQIKSRVVRPPEARHNRHFKPLARWEGAVLEVFATYFVAEVIDLDRDERAIVEFDRSEVGIADQPLCEPGALFYWSVGYDIKESGQLSRASVLRFRRLGAGVGYT